MVFPVVMYGCESWTIKKAEHWRIAAFELWCWRRPLDCKEIKPVHPKGNQSWIFTGETDAEAEAPVLWPPDEKSQIIGKDPDAGRGWSQEEKGATEGKMVGWHHQFKGHECERAPGYGEGHRSLACCSAWGLRAKHDWVTEMKWTVSFYVCDGQEQAKLVKEKTPEENLRSGGDIFSSKRKSHDL